MPTKIKLNIINELKDTLDALDRKKYPTTAISFTLEDDTEVFYCRRMLNHDYYDSLIFSGRVDELESSVIQPLQDIFRTIKDHNDYLTRALHLEDDAPPETKIPYSAVSYFQWMDKNEKILVESIPKMIKKLEE